MQTPETVSSEPTKILAIIRRCRQCGAVVARTFRDPKHPGRFSAPHTCPPPPAASLALAA
jgi:hypothetical protein